MEINFTQYPFCVYEYLASHLLAILNAPQSKNSLIIAVLRIGFLAIVPSKFNPSLALNTFEFIVLKFLGIRIE